VLQRLADKARALEEAVRGYLYHSTGLEPTQWANLQARAGFDRGIATGLNFAINLEHEEVDASQDEGR
jgi:hypothetical protein